MDNKFRIEKEGKWYRATDAMGNSAVGDSGDDASQKLKEKLHVEEVLTEIFKHSPEDDKKIDWILKLLKRDSQRLWFQLKDEHIIYDNDYHYIDAKVMINHLDLVKNAIKDYGHDIELYCIDDGKHYAIVDKAGRKNFQELMRKHYYNE